MVAQQRPDAAQPDRRGNGSGRRLERQSVLATWLLTSVLCVLAAGCGPTGGVKPSGPPSKSSVAADLRREGAFAEAASLYLELKEATSGPDANYFGMRAADAWLDAGRLPLAATAFDETLDPSVNDAPSPRNLATYRLVAARLALARGTGTLAADRLSGVVQADLPRDLTPTFWRLKAELSEASGQLVAAILSRLELEAALAPDNPLRVPNAARLWTLINRTSSEDREALSGVEDIQLAGWYELARAVRLDIGDPERLEGSLARFSERHPKHPANLSLTSELVDKARRLLERPARVALILPLGSERLGGLARVIRDGFLTAYFADAPESRPERVRVYDAGDDQAAAAYTRAVADGAEFVVGPLTKSNIERMLAEVDFSRPALVLNHVESRLAARTAAGEAQPAELYQFGLPPEKEARTVAENAWSFGYRRALTLAPIDNWGQRVVTAFSERWQDLGGEILEATRFTNEGPAYSSAVARVIGVEASRERAAALERLLGRNLEFVPRAREDADFLFMAARPVEARQIVPQLRYFGAEHIPVLATSHVYNPEHKARTFSDLEGVRFTDMPWILGLTEDAAARAFERGFATRHGANRRLFALGADAYHLAGNAARLKAVPDSGYQGLTGRLTVDPQGYVEREPAWGRFGEEGAATLQMRPTGSPPAPTSL